VSSTQGQTQTLSRSQARRVALAAQGFLDKPHAGPTMRTFDRTLARTGVLQVDSVNVLQRAHYMPLYSRMGPYDADPRTGLLARAAEKRPRRVVEYWAHVQAFMPVDLWPLMQHRMDFYRAARGKWWKDVEDSMIERVRVAVAAQPGPVTARELEQVIGSGGPRSKEHWGWNWSEARKTLDFLYQIGELAIAGRTTQFEVRYDLPERVLPAQILDLPVLDPQDAVTELVRRAARSHGVATASCLADYYRLRQQHDPKRPDLPSTAVAIEQLVGTEGLAEVVVGAGLEGGQHPARVGGTGEHEHRDVGPGAQLGEHLDPVAVGQRQVQHHDVRRGGGSGRQGLALVRGAGDVETRPGQHLAQGGLQLQVVVHDQCLHRLGAVHRCGRHPSSASMRGSRSTMPSGLTR
jgi:hypothetical protein